MLKIIAFQKLVNYFEKKSQILQSKSRNFLLAQFKHGTSKDPKSTNFKLCTPNLKTFY